MRRDHASLLQLRRLGLPDTRLVRDDLQRESLDFTESLDLLSHRPERPLHPLDPRMRVAFRLAKTSSILHSAKSAVSPRAPDANDGRQCEEANSQERKPVARIDHSAPQ